MAGKLTFDELKKAIKDGEIDTVLAAQVDMQGRLMGKRFQAEFFAESAWEETHCCNYLLATDMEMHTVDGYKSTSWEAGYGDYTMKPDLDTIRRIPWLEGTALVLCDMLDHHGQHEIAHAPRNVLKKQLRRLEDMGMMANFASELEFFLFKQSFEEACEGGYRGLTPISAYNEDYHIFQTTKEEDVMRAIRNGLNGADIPVENSKGEADAGQEEINVRYADALSMADRHVIIKNGCKEIAWQKGRALSFMAKWSYDYAGNSSHVHQSLWSLDGKPLFFDPDADHGMSELMRQYLAGLLHHASEITYFLAPYINSYKRFAEGTFAPTKAIWSLDNRTAGYRICGEDSKAVRIECRVGGSDLNPYLAFAALLAAGIDGIENKRELEPAFVGDAYHGGDVREIPSTLRAATEALDNSAMLRKAFRRDLAATYELLGDHVVAVHRRNLVGQVEPGQQLVQRLSESSDPVACLVHGSAEVLRVFNQEAEGGAVGLNRLHPERKIQRKLLQRPVIERIDGTESRSRLWSDLLLLQPTPVLVLALQHRLERRATQTALFAQNRQKRYGRKVPVRNDAVDRRRELVEDSPSLVEDVVQAVTLLINHLFRRQK